MNDEEAHEEAVFSVAENNKKMQSSAQSNGYRPSSQQQTATQIARCRDGR